jgi:hypothetical protein
MPLSFGGQSCRSMANPQLRPLRDKRRRRRDGRSSVGLRLLRGLRGLRGGDGRVIVVRAWELGLYALSEFSVAEIVVLAGVLCLDGPPEVFYRLCR